MIALGLVALAAAATFIGDRWAKVMCDRLDFDRSRYEARRPVPPHDALVARVAALESEFGAIKTWAKQA